MNKLPTMLRTVRRLNASLSSKKISKSEHSAGINAIKAEVVSDILASYEAVLDRPLVLKPEEFRNGRVAFEDQSSIPDGILKNISEQIVQFCAAFDPLLRMRIALGLPPPIEVIDFEFLKFMVRKRTNAETDGSVQTLGDLMVRKEWLSPYSTKHPNNQGYDPSTAIADALVFDRFTYGGGGV